MNFFMSVVFNKKVHKSSIATEAIMLKKIILQNFFRSQLEKDVIFEL